MTFSAPPPLRTSQPVGMCGLVKVLVVLASVQATLMAGLVALRLCGWIRPFNVPSGGMAPAVAPGDHVLMEGFTFLYRKPHRGDIAVFRTDGITWLPARTIYVKRIAGQPGEHVRISDSRLYINDTQVVITNGAGVIAYSLPPAFRVSGSNTDLTVPQDKYFVLGDNSTNSLDSRFWGCLPAKNVLGRIWFCYWPPARIGVVR